MTDGRVADVATLFLLKVAQVRRGQARESKSFPLCTRRKADPFYWIGGCRVVRRSRPSSPSSTPTASRTQARHSGLLEQKGSSSTSVRPFSSEALKGGQKSSGALLHRGRSLVAFARDSPSERALRMAQTEVLSSWWSSVQMDTGCKLLVPKGPLILAPATDNSTCSTLTPTGEFSDRHKVLLFTSQQVGASSDPVVFADDEFLTRLV